MIKKIITLILPIIFALGISPASAWVHGVVSNIVPGCPYPTNGADGCPAALVAGGPGLPGLYTYQSVYSQSLWQLGPQSGQSWSGTRPSQITWNVACQDYGCGPWTVDASLKPALNAPATGASGTLQMTITPGFPSGVSGMCAAYSSTTHQIRCNTDLWTGQGTQTGNTFTVSSTTTGSLAVGEHLDFNCSPGSVGAWCITKPNITASCGAGCWTVDGAPQTTSAGPNLIIGTSDLNVTGWNFNDVGFLNNGHAGITFSNNHITIGSAYCTILANGTTVINLGGGDVDAYNWLGDQDATCKQYANLYKQTNDPGLATQANFTGAIVSGVLTIGVGTTGHISFNQFLDYSGRAAGKQYQICASGTVASCRASSGGNPSSCDGAACDGTTWNVTEGPCARTTANGQQGSCENATYPNGIVTSLNVASVAMTTGPIMNSVPYMTNSGGEFTKIHMARVMYYGTYALQGSGNRNIVLEYNACRIAGWVAVHASCFVDNGNPAITNPVTTSTRDNYTAQYNVSWYDNLSRGGAGTSNMTMFTTTGTANSGGASGIQMVTTNALYDHNFFFSNLGDNNAGSNQSSSTQPVDSLASILNQGAGLTNPGHIGTATWSNNVFDTRGATNACRAGGSPISAYTQIGVIVSTNNWNLSTGAPVNCPDAIN